MSEWITDRLPTAEDALPDGGVWIMSGGRNVILWQYGAVEPGQPWQPIPRPAPYVKPKRWTVEEFCKSYRVTDGNVSYYFPAPCTEAQAQRIAAAFNEVMP
jgi:hypothetical protein